MKEILENPLPRELSNAEAKAKEIAATLPESRENWKIKKRGIIIVGDSGGGKTTLAYLLGEVYGTPETRNFKIGEIIRRLSGSERTAGFIDRDPLIDKLVDDLQIELIRNALDNDPFILEARLGGKILRDERRKNPKLGQLVKSVLISVPPDIRINRLGDRMPHLSKAEIERLTLERAHGDNQRWTDVHPELLGQNPYDPKLFDKVIDASAPIIDNFYAAHNWLSDIGFVEKMEISQAKLQQPEVIFEA